MDRLTYMEMEMETEESPTTSVDPSCPPFPHLQPQQENINGELPVLELPTRDLAAACRELGVFRLVNHGVPGDLSWRLFGLVQELRGRGSINNSFFKGKKHPSPTLHSSSDELSPRS